MVLPLVAASWALYGSLLVWWLTATVDSVITVLSITVLSDCQW